MKSLIVFSAILFLKIASAQAKGTWVTCTSVEVVGRVSATTTIGSGREQVAGSTVDSHGPIGEVDFRVFYVHGDRNQSRQVGEATFVYTASNETFQLGMQGEYGRQSTSVKLNELEKIEGENQARQEMFLSQTTFPGTKSSVPKLHATLCKFSERIPVYEEPQGGFQWGNSKTNSDIRSAPLAQIRRLLGDGK
jgi:hypothetical protein